MQRAPRRRAVSRVRLAGSRGLASCSPLGECHPERVGVVPRELHLWSRSSRRPWSDPRPPETWRDRFGPGTAGASHQRYVSGLGGRGSLGSEHPSCSQPGEVFAVRASGSIKRHPWRVMGRHGGRRGLFLRCSVGAQVPAAVFHVKPGRSRRDPPTTVLCSRETRTLEARSAYDRLGSRSGDGVGVYPVGPSLSLARVARERRSALGAASTPATCRTPPACADAHHVSRGTDDASRRARHSRRARSGTTHAARGGEVRVA